MTTGTETETPCYIWVAFDAHNDPNRAFRTRSGADKFAIEMGADGDFPWRVRPYSLMGGKFMTEQRKAMQWLEGDWDAPYREYVHGKDK